MSHSLVTVIAPLPAEKVAAARQLVDALGNPATVPVCDALEKMASSQDVAVHFSSLNVFVGGEDRAYLVFEFSADGDESSVLTALASSLGPQLAPIFELASDRGSEPLDRYWSGHQARVGQGYFSVAGLAFAGTPEMSVRRILAERDLFTQVLSLLHPEVRQDSRALPQLEAVRAQLRDSPEWKWALTPLDTRALGSATALGFGVIARMVWSVIVTFGWPLLAVIAAAMVTAAATQWLRDQPWLKATLWTGGIATVVAIVASIAVLGIAYFVLRRRETTEAPENRRADPALVASVVAREDALSQNHLAAIFDMKPGRLRKFTVRLAFKVIGELAGRVFRPGFLGELGTIHFARWVMIPGTDNLLFLSNYGGSWESYLEDFITRAHQGLTAVWSNTVGFPRTKNLFQDGATDGARFKNWARRCQIPTGFWYSAYPSLTTTAIRRNAAVRQGLATALTEDEAHAWLSLFGSQQRPSTALEVNEIQSLVFGGLGFLNHGTVLPFRLTGDPAAARRWLGQLRIAYGDGRRYRDKEAVTLGLTPSGLRRLGLPDSAVETFPQAFLDGMTAPWRLRALGDVGPNAPQHWWWGGAADHLPDGVLLLYAAEAGRLAALRDRVAKALRDEGHLPLPEVKLVPFADKNASAKAKRLSKTEPFGFFDGVSQPVIRGSYKALRSADPIHVVEAGEFILGYPDNRGTVSPTPTIDALADPSAILPVSASVPRGFQQPLVNEPRDVGRNGSFLVIRQLEQDVQGFWEYCEKTALDLDERFPDWKIKPDFVGAKLVGRWPDGSSLVRYPYAPATEPSQNSADGPSPRCPAGHSRDSADGPPQHCPTGPSGDSGAAPPKESPSASTSQRPLSRTAPAAAAIPATDVGPAARGTTEASVKMGEPDNDFLFGSEDPQGLRCPFGAHVRRSNPRESFDPGSSAQLSITNRHRILRVGRKYQPETGQDPGLFFMCLNADLERQFEFIQQTWLQHGSFHGLAGERDPLLGDRDSEGTFVMPTRYGPVQLPKLPQVVTMRGGGYFFLPSRSLVEYLVKGPTL